MYDQTRTASFSSSSIWKLMTKDKSGKKIGAPGLKYIKQVGYEEKLGRAIQKDFESKETSWGTLVEKRAFKLLPTDYQYVANQGRLVHTQIKKWTGIPDFLKDTDTVADCKCPFSLEKFCDKMDALNSGYETFKNEFPEDFWQLVSGTALLRSNSIDIKFIEAINYMPYESEIEEIRSSAEDDSTMKWLTWTSNDGLPWLRDGGYYKNLNVHRFEVKEDDVNALTERVMEAISLLITVE